MAVSNRMEKEKLDAEEREALKMTRAELMRLAEQGSPAKVARKPPRRLGKSAKQAGKLVKADRSSNS